MNPNKTPYNLRSHSKKAGASPDFPIIIPSSPESITIPSSPDVSSSPSYEPFSFPHVPSFSPPSDLNNVVSRSPSPLSDSCNSPFYDSNYNDNNHDNYDS